MTKRVTLLIILFTYFLYFDVNANTKTVIEADTITSDSKNSTVCAKGNVKIKRDKYEVSADEIIYDKEKRKIYLKNKAKLVDTNNNSVFAESGVVDDDIQKGEFSNAGFVMNNGISITSPTIIKNDQNIYKAYNTNYYFCPNKNLNMDLSYDEIIKQMKRNKIQIFSLSSKRSKIDKPKNKIYLNHIFLKFLDIPFFYFPYLSTSRPFINRVSGFSAPSIIKNSEYGYAIGIPVKFYFGNNFDYIFKPYFYQDGNILVDNTIRYKNENFYFKFDPFYAYDNNRGSGIKNIFNIKEKDEKGYSNNRFYFKLDTNGRISNNTYFYIKGEVAGDNYFVSDYLGKDDEYLKTKVKLFELNDYGYISIGGTGFQEIAEKIGYHKKNNDIYGIGEFSYRYIKNIYNESYNKIDLDFNLNTDSIFNQYKNGYTRTRIENNFSYKTIFLNTYIENNFNLYASSYNYFNNNTELNDENILIPEYNINIATPFFLFGNSNIITKPIVQYYFAGKNNKNNIKKLRQDSISSEVNINNLFTGNRYSGYDLFETGNRINYGIETNIYTKYGDINIISGQGYKDTLDADNKIYGFEDNFSDVLNGINYNHKYLKFSYLNNLDSRQYKIKRQEFIFSAVLMKFTFGSSYVLLKDFDAFDSKDINRQEQVNFDIIYDFTDNFRIALNLENNLVYNKFLNKRLNFIYDNDCFLIQLAFKDECYIEKNKKKDFSVTFNFRLKNEVFDDRN